MAGTPTDITSNVSSTLVGETAVEQAFSEVEQAIQSAQADAAASRAAQPVTLPELAASMLPQDAVNSIDLLGDVEMHVTVELGRTQMLVEDVLRLSEGSVVELDKLAGDPVDVFVNNRLIARGEVLVLNDNFCIRISEIVADLEDQVAQAAAQQAGQTG